MTTLNNQITLATEDDVNALLKANGMTRYTFDVTAHYDTDLARAWFSDFEQEIDARSIITDNYLVIFSNNAEMRAPFYKKSKLARMKRDDLVELSITLGLLNWDNGAVRAELIDDLLNVSCADYYNHYTSNTSWRDFDETFTIHGYSQGDAKKVLIVGKGDDVNYFTADYLTNLYFDTPVVCHVDVYENGDFVSRLEVADSLKNVYDYVTAADLTKAATTAMTSAADTVELYKNEAIKAALLAALAAKAGDSLDYI